MDPVEYRETWRRRIAAFQESGLSVPQWCATQKNATVPQVQYWKKKFEKETSSSLPASSPSSWVQVGIGSEGAPAPFANQNLSIGKKIKEPGNSSWITFRWKRSIIV